VRWARKPQSVAAAAHRGAGLGGGDQRREVFVAANLWFGRRHRYLTEPAVMPATRKRWSSRKPTTIGTLTVSDAAMIWFQ
jgi:hypothetical protein